MSSFEAFILGLVQGLTEFLPVSSSGHLAIGKHLFGIESGNLTFEILVHAATVLATIVVFRKEIWDLLCGLFKFKYNSQTRYVAMICVSMIPVLIVGVFFKDTVEEIFGSGLLIVGIMLLVTASLLAFSYFAKPRQREEISPLHAFIIGIGQAVAVLPGLSRSGTTIATGLLLGNKKERMAQFSFLMVIPPVLGEALLDVMDIAKQGFGTAMDGISAGSLIIGFLAAFITGCLACKWMINIVKKGKLIWFAVYCLIVGILAIILSL